MTPPTRSDEWEEDEEIQVLSGSANTSDSEPQLGDALLDLTLALIRLKILLLEVDEQDWKASSVRLSEFKRAVQELPEKPRPRRLVGFTPPVKKSRTR